MGGRIEFLNKGMEQIIVFGLILHEVNGVNNDVPGLETVLNRIVFNDNLAADSFWPGRFLGILLISNQLFF